MKLNSESLPVVLGISIIVFVAVGLTATIATFLNDSASKAQEAEEELYSRNSDRDFQSEDTEELIVPVPEQNQRGTGVPVEVNSNFSIDDYSSSTNISSSSGYSYSSSTDYSDRPFSPFDNPSNTRSLSSQSLTRPGFSNDTSSSSSYSSSTNISSESLLDSTENDSNWDSLGTSSFSTRERDNSTGVDAFGENSQF